MAEGDEATTNNIQPPVEVSSNTDENLVDPSKSPTLNGHTDGGRNMPPTVMNISENEVSPNEPMTTTSASVGINQLRLARANYCKAVLLNATYLALAGRAADARRLFQIVCAEDSGAELMVRVNALIKSACLSMSVDQVCITVLFNTRILFSPP